MRLIFLGVFCCISLCAALWWGKSSQREDPFSRKQRVLEHISRTSSETLAVNAPLVQSRPTYPWSKKTSDFPVITKEYFRCRGSVLHPPHISQNQSGKTTRVYDCGGMEKHSLPLKEGKEFVFPVLTDLLNFIQERLGKRVVITSGHRCPEHNLYVDASAENQTSKHLLGAEVSFYVQDLEKNPEKVIEEIFHYYQEHPTYAGMSEYGTFSRYRKSNLLTSPWMNKEILIKLFQPHEGRNLDNRHPYSYISIQVRHDKEENKKVDYTWNLAHRNYLRY